MLCTIPNLATSGIMFAETYFYLEIKWQTRAIVFAVEMIAIALKRKSLKDKRPQRENLGYSPTGG